MTDSKLYIEIYDPHTLKLKRVAGPFEPGPDAFMRADNLRTGTPHSIVRDDRPRHCTNSEPGWYNGECGQPSTWRGMHYTGKTQEFCDDCREHGHEAKTVKQWARIKPDTEK